MFDFVLSEAVEKQILIVDGSALNLFAKAMPISIKTCHLILTPHQKEWERLSGLAIADQSLEKTQMALEKFSNGQFSG